MALDEAARAVAEDQGSEDPDEWSKSSSDEEIVFLPNVALAMHWVNRPTTQVLAMFGREPAAVPGTDAEPEAPMPSTGGGLIVLALLTWLARPDSGDDGQVPLEERVDGRHELGSVQQ